MRPKTIAWFEQLYMLAILVEVVRIALQWKLLAGSTPADMWIRIAAVVISLALVLLASRGGKRIAGILLAALFVIGLPTVVTVFQGGFSIANQAFIILQVLIQAAAILLFFAPASRAWYAGR